MLARIWFFLAGASASWAICSGAARRWPECAFFVAFMVGALAVPMRGWLGTSERAPVEDRTASFRRARLQIVRRGE